MSLSTSSSWPLKVTRTNFPARFTAQQIYRTTDCTAPRPTSVSLCLNMAYLHTHSTGDRGMLKMKRKTISSADVPVWGNEIARLIVACNGEQSEVN